MLSSWFIVPWSQFLVPLSPCFGPQRGRTDGHESRTKDEEQVGVNRRNRCNLWIGCRTDSASVVQPTGKQNTYRFPHAIVQTHLNDFNARIQVAHHPSKGRMKAESWADDIEQRRAVGDVHTREITEFAELTMVIQPLDTQPVVQALHQQIDLLLQLKFD